MSHLARSKIRNAVTSVRKSYRSHSQEKDEYFVGYNEEQENTYWYEDNGKQKQQQESRDHPPSGIPRDAHRNGLRDYWNQESIERFRSRFGSSVERPTRMFGDFLNNIFGYCAGGGDVVTDWNCSNMEYRAPPASYGHGLGRGHYHSYSDGHMRAGQDGHHDHHHRRDSRRKHGHRPSKSHHDMMDVLQGRMMKSQMSNDACFYAQQQPNVGEDYNAVIGARRREKQGPGDGDGHTLKKNTTTHSEDNVAGKTCKLSEIKPLLQHHFSSGPDTPTTLIVNKSPQPTNDTGYPINIEEDDKSLDTFAYDDGISVLSAHTLEEMAKLEMKKKNSASEQEPLEQGFDIIIQVEGKESNHKNEKVDPNSFLNDRMVVRKEESMEGDSQPPSPVGTEGSISTDNTNSRSAQQLNTPESVKKSRRANIPPPPSSQRRSNKSVKSLNQYPVQMRRSLSGFSKKTDHTTSTVSNFVDVWKTNELKYWGNVVVEDENSKEKDDDNTGNDSYKAKSSTTEERNRLKSKTTTHPTTPKRNNRNKDSVSHTGNQEDTSKLNEKELPVVSHYEATSADGTGKRKKKSRSRLPFFGRWNAVEYMQCVGEDVS